MVRVKALVITKAMMPYGLLNSKVLGSSTNHKAPENFASRSRTEWVRTLKSPQIKMSKRRLEGGNKVKSQDMHFNPALRPRGKLNGA